MREIKESGRGKGTRVLTWEEVNGSPRNSAVAHWVVGREQRMRREREKERKTHTGTKRERKRAEVIHAITYHQWLVYFPLECERRQNLTLF